MKTKLLFFIITSLFTIQFFSQSTTYVPDDNFEHLLIALGYDSGALDDYVLTSNINTLTTLNISSANIADLSGIEDFIALQNLYADDNNLSNVNLSQNTALELLWIDNNQLTNLDVTLLTGLQDLSIENNQITTIDLSQNPNLMYLGAYNNQLASLDLSSNTNLQEVFCYNNQLTNLNIKNGNNANITGFIATGNPNLICIEVDDAAWSASNWVNINSTSSFSENCTVFNSTYVPDDVFENYLETHNAYGNVVTIGNPTSMGNGIASDNYVTTANINTITDLMLRNLPIADLTGIEDFTALTKLHCINNLLTNLNLSANTALTELKCSRNQLSNLDLSANILLMKLNCSDNQLSDLDLSLNTALIDLNCSNNHSMSSLDMTLNSSLTRLNCYNNQLTSLHVKNGNNANFTSFNSSNNPNLICIEVDDATWSATNWTDIDAASIFVNNQAECSSLSVDEFHATNFSTYPNPSQGIITIHAIKEVSLIIYTIHGKKVLKRKLTKGNNELSNLNLASGVYLFRLSSENESITKAIIIKK
ncbi:leucine-rich repeat domain-containing protein [Tenacibaculum sp. MAR_2009_124]|uniref:leucine-rich repeat domain-containing protein n=1 Tax=Tenacibaculum sp. MAR_2009_124 TaxID=1250059 RepID=UPI0015A0BC30|nr:T9SS type A sorting domain-containing protein [Tenacibaculum sp. MAR_2009_124]